MAKCIEPKVGALLHAYELQLLSEEETECFELHLMKCEHCLNRIRSIGQNIEMLTSASEVAELIDEVAEVEPVDDIPVLKKLWRYIWPETSPILRPALLYVVILLLIIPAYHGLIKPGKEVVTGTKITYIVTNRSAEDNVITLEPRIEHYLEFELSDRINCEICQLVIESFEGEVMLDLKAFASINVHRVGILLLPDIQPGIYRLIFTDPQTGLSDTTHFKAKTK
jgi:hypothetical protein